MDNNLQSASLLRSYGAPAFVSCATILATLILPLFINEAAYTCTRMGCSTNDSAVAIAFLVLVGGSIAGGVVALWSRRYRWLGKAISVGLGVTAVCYVCLLFWAASEMR